MGILSALLQKKSNNAAIIVMFPLYFYQGLAPLAMLCRPVRAGEFDANKFSHLSARHCEPFWVGDSGGKGCGSPSLKVGLEVVKMLN